MFYVWYIVKIVVHIGNIPPPCLSEGNIPLVFTTTQFDLVIRPKFYAVTPLYVTKRVYAATAPTTFI